MPSEWLSAVGTVIGAIGGGAVVVFGLSGWLGKVWAERLMNTEKAEHARKLASEQAEHATRLKELESRLRGDVDAGLTLIKTQLEFQRGKHEKAHADKLSAYHDAIHRVAKFFGDLNALHLNLPGARPFLESFAEFESARFEVYGRMALVAPQSVMNAYDELVVMFLDNALKGTTPDWARTRELALGWINAARQDIGVVITEIGYSRGIY